MFVLRIFIDSLYHVIDISLRNTSYDAYVSVRCFKTNDKVVY